MCKIPLYPPFARGTCQAFIMAPCRSLSSNAFIGGGDKFHAFVAPHGAWGFSEHLTDPHPLHYG